MTALKIGLLLPSSTILPIAKNYEDGFNLGIHPIKEKIGDIDIYAEFIGQGNTKDVENACNKFFNYHNVDVITGVISNKVAEIIAPKFGIKKIPIIVSNLGGHQPNLESLNDNILLNSFHLWQHAWTLGYWGVQHIGKKGMFVAGIYDAGYSFSEMFYKGMKAANVDAEWYFSVPPLPAAGELCDMTPIFEYLEKFKPDFIFAVFCGTEATLFLSEFIKRGWSKRTKLLGLPFLITPFSPLSSDLEIVISGYDPSLIIKPVESFSQLGFQAGRSIASLSFPLKKDHLSAELVDSGIVCNPLGFTKFNSTQIVTISEVLISELSVEPQVKKIEEVRPFILNDSKYSKEISSVWVNPYLCI